MNLYDDPTTVAAAPALPAASNVGYFSDGVPGSQARTLIRAWWLNLVAQELTGVVTAAGLIPSRSNNGQLLQAIQLLAAVPVASHAAAGKVQLATASQVEAGTDDALAVTSLGVAGAIQAAVTALVGGAPPALSILKELATALNNDPTFATDIFAALALKAPLAAPALALDANNNFPTTPTPPGGDATNKVANMAALAAQFSANRIQGNFASVAGPWWSWDPTTLQVKTWGNSATTITAEGVSTVAFPVNIGTYQHGRAGTLNATSSNVGSTVIDVISGTATSLSVFANDSEGNSQAAATGFWWEAIGYSASLPAPT
jgi:hypothetical protein